MHIKVASAFPAMLPTISGMDTGRICAMARCRIGAGEGEGDATTGVVGGVRDPGPILNKPKYM